MNKIYKVMYSKVKQCCVVVSEIAKSHGRHTKSSVAKSSAALTAGVLIALGSFSFEGMPVAQADESIMNNDFVGANDYYWYYDEKDKEWKTYQYKATDSFNNRSRHDLPNYKGAGAKAPGAITAGLSAQAGQQTVTIGDRNAGASRGSIFIGEHSGYDDGGKNSPTGARNNYVTSVGFQSDATGWGSIAIGSNAIAENSKMNSDTVKEEGNYNTTGTVRDDTYSIEANPTIDGASVALGYNAHSKDGNIAIGANSDATSTDGGDSYLSVGSETLKRRITNVAQGTGDSDVVTLGQMNEAIKKTDASNKANIDASNIGNNLTVDPVYQTDEKGAIIKGSDDQPLIDEEKTTAKRNEDQTTNKNAWGAAIGTGSIANPTESKDNDPTKNGSQQLVTGGTVYNALQQQADNLKVNAGWGINVNDVTTKNADDTETTTKNVISLNRNLGTNYGNPWKGEGKVTFEAGGENSMILGGAASILQSNEKDNVKAGAYGKDSVLVGGFNNLIDTVANDVTQTGEDAVIVGGDTNKVTGLRSVIVGGYQNKVSGGHSIVIGGESNETDGGGAGVFGGQLNKAAGGYSSVLGGDHNEADGDWSSAIGGTTNTASGRYATVLGGVSNDAKGNESAVVGGTSNVAIGEDSTVNGGAQNTSYGTSSYAAGGMNNMAFGNVSVALGGQYSSVNGISSTGIAGGSTGENAMLTLAAGYQSVVTDSGVEWRPITQDEADKINQGINSWPGFSGFPDFGDGSSAPKVLDRISTAVGYQSTADAPGVIAFGHDKGDVASVAKKWKQKATEKDGKYYDANDKEISDEDYYKLVNADGTWNDYTQDPIGTENTTYQSAYYNRLVKAADGIDAHDAVVMEQLKPYTKSDASNIGSNLKTYTVGDDGETITEADATPEKQKKNKDDWGKALGADPFTAGTTATATDASTSDQLVTGKTLYNYDAPVAETGKTLNYVSANNTTGQNLLNLDRQVKTNTDTLSDVNSRSVKYDTKTENGKTVVDNTKITLAGEGGTTITNLKDGVKNNDAATVGQLDDRISGVTYEAGNGIDMSNKKISAVAGTGITVNAKGINVNTGKHLSVNTSGKVDVDDNGEVAADDGNLVTGKTVYDALHGGLDNITVGKDGQNGKDGSIGIAGQNGKDGYTMTIIKTEQGAAGVDGKDGITRVVYQDKDGNGKHTFATLDDGLKFKGDDSTVIARKLNEQLNITGGADSTNLTDKNIGVNSSTDGLKIQLAKNLAGITSIANQTTTGKGDAQTTTGAKIDLKDDGSISVNSGKITDVKSGLTATDGTYADTDKNNAANIGDVHSMIEKEAGNTDDKLALKANVAADNIGTHITDTTVQKTNLDNWGAAIGTGAVADSTNEHANQLVTGKTVYDALHGGLDNITVGKDGQNGKDGSIGIAGQNGKDGYTMTIIKTEQGAAGVDGKDGITRVVYQDKDGNGKHTFATLDDGLKFKGDDSTVIARKLNEQLNITGGADSTNLTDKNIGVNSSTDGLKIQLAKNLAGITSIANQTTTGKGDAQTTTGAKIDLKDDGSISVNSGKITDVKSGLTATDGTYADTDKNNAANIGDVHSMIEKEAGNTDDKLALKANVAADNIGTHITDTTVQKTNLDNWGAAIGTGAVADSTNEHANQLVTGKTVYDALHGGLDNITVGKDGKDGKDAVSISGKDGVGHIGLTGPAGTNGKDGASIDITVKNGYDKDGKDGKDGINGENGVDGTSLTRIVYEDKNGEHQVATMEDGLKFKGDGDTVIAKKLNNTMEIIGGADSTKLTDKNIGVNSDGDKLKVQLSKDLTGMNSTTYTTTTGEGESATTSTTVVNGNGLTITDGPSITNKGIDGGNKVITNVGSGIEKDANDKYTVTDQNKGNAANIGDVQNIVNDAKKDLTEGTNGLNNKANVDASNIGANLKNAEDQKANAKKWGSAIGTGEIKADDGRMVTGKTVYDEVRPKKDGNYVKKNQTTGENLSALDSKIGKLDETKKYNYIDSGKDVSISNNLTKLDTQVKTNADAISKETKDREAAITNITNNIGDLSNSAVKYDADSNKGKVTLAGANGTTITNLKAGAVTEASKDAVNGSQLYAEQKARTDADTKLTSDLAAETQARTDADTAINNKIGTLDKDGNYIKKDASVSSNLSTLDTQVKTTSDLIHTDANDDTIIQIGGNSTATKVDVSGKDKDGKSTGRIITGVVTDAGDPTSAANVGYVNGVTAANTQQIYRDMNNAYGRLNNNINKAAAGSNALAALHPLDYDPDDKADFAAGYGHYRNANAAAVGVFYHPNENTMVNVGVSMGNGDPGFNAGVSFKVGRGGAGREAMSRTEMAKVINSQSKEIDALKKDNADKDKRIDALEQKMAEILAKLDKNGK